MPHPFGIPSALIIPALNEAEVIGAMLDAVPRDWYAAIVVADNASTDGTAEIARSRGAMVVSEPQRGYGAACLAALAVLPPGIEAVVFMQADLSEDPEEAAGLVGPIAEGRADFVLGSRVERALPGSLTLAQRLGNALATTLIRIRFGRRFSDLGPFRAIRRSSLDRLEMADRTYGWTVEMQIKALRAGLRVEEVPVSYRPRAAGVNKVSGQIGVAIRAGWKILWTIWRYW